MLKIVSNIKSDFNEMEFLDLPDVMMFVEDNSEEFENHEILAIVDFENRETKFIRVKLKTTFSEM